MQTEKSNAPESAIRSTMRDLISQFAAVASPLVLRPSLRAVTVASLLAATFAAHAQNNPQVLPQRSAAGWGAQLGGILLGEAVRDSVSTGNRGIDRVLTGVATEIGRNGGSVLAQQPYGDQPANQSQQRVVNYAPMSVHEADHLDTQALRTLFAYESFLANVSGRTLTNQEYQRTAAPYVAQRQAFEAAYQIAWRNRQDVRPWHGLLTGFQARAGAVSMAHLSSQASPMLARLQRPGGPGFSQQPQQTQTLDGLRQQMHQRHAMAPAPVVDAHPSSNGY